MVEMSSTGTGTHQNQKYNGHGNDFTFYMLCTLLLSSFIIICLLIPINIFPTSFISNHYNHSSSSTLNSLSQQQHQSSSKDSHVDVADADNGRDELEVALAKAATLDKTVIIALVNKAYVEEGDKPMFDIFLDSFWLGDGTRDLIKQLLIVAVDQTSYDRCQFLRLNCYRLQTEGIDFAGEEIFMSVNFVKLVWRRIQFLGDVAKRGYNFIFTDTDVLWLRNPFTKLKLDESIDLQISTDFYVYNEHKELQEKFVNTGFYMLRSNNKTIAFLDAWHANQDYSKKEQDVLVKLLMNNNNNNDTAHKLDLNIHFLDTLYFSGFCEKSRDIAQVITVHANCCISITAKMVDLTSTLHDWMTYYHNNKTATTDHHHHPTTAMSSTTFKWSEHAACINASKNFYH